jgi:hypothetical protein
MPNKRPERGSEKKSVQMRVTPEAARKARIAAALLDMTPGQAVKEGMDLYANKHHKRAIRTLGNMGLKPKK